MPKKGPPATHINPKPSTATALANLEVVGAVMDRDVEEDVDD